VHRPRPRPRGPTGTRGAPRGRGTLCRPHPWGTLARCPVTPTPTSALGSPTGTSRLGQVRLAQGPQHLGAQAAAPHPDARPGRCWPGTLGTLPAGATAPLLRRPASGARDAAPLISPHCAATAPLTPLRASTGATPRGALLPRGPHHTLGRCPQQPKGRAVAVRGWPQHLPHTRGQARQERHALPRHALACSGTGGPRASGGHVGVRVLH
jgi:hypothetical protein